MKIHEAVSAVFVRGDAVFMIKRQPYLEAFPGYHAFPGGKVDRDDPDRPLSGLLGCGPARPMHALVRELREELDFDLEAAVAEGLVTDVNPFAVATAPPFSPIRFSNAFYRIDLREEPAFRVDAQEAEASAWSAPRDLIERYDRGRLLAVPPVLKMLQALVRDPEIRTIDDIDFSYDEATEVPCMELFRDFYQLPVRSKTLPPADRTNAFVIGDTLVDPSPESEAELARLERVLARLKPRKIMLTHHHGDHHQFADVLARKQGWPIWCSADTHARLSGKHPGYFDGIEVRHLGDGDRLTSWRGEAVTVFAIPGHDAGQLGIAPESLAWFIVGDLIQGIGTVVIAAPEGNMRQYFASLRRVIDLDPPIIIPSHGTAMGSTFRLRATLAHREKREAQVLELWRAGRTPNQILEVVYKGLDPRLAPFAFANIQSHLGKLREEGTIS